MSHTTARRTRVLGITAAGALLLTLPPVSGAQAANSTSTNDFHRILGSARSAAGPPGMTVGKADDDPPIYSACTGWVSVAPTTAVIGASAVKKTFSIKVTGCTVGQWFVLIVPFVNDFSNPFPWPNVATMDNPTITLSPKVLTNGNAGRVQEVNEMDVHVWAKGEDPDTVISDSLAPGIFTLLRRSTWGTTVNASPEPVKKGKTITIKGTLKRVSWTPKNKPYVVFAGQRALVQFRASGTCTWKTIKTVKTASTGKVSTTTKATQSGYWRLRFAGISTTGSSNSASDYVKVN